MKKTNKVGTNPLFPEDLTPSIVSESPTSESLKSLPKDTATITFEDQDSKQTDRYFIDDFDKPRPVVEETEVSKNYKMLLHMVRQLDERVKASIVYTKRTRDLSTNLQTDFTNLKDELGDTISLVEHSVNLAMANHKELSTIKDMIMDIQIKLETELDSVNEPKDPSKLVKID